MPPYDATYMSLSETDKTGAKRMAKKRITDIVLLAIVACCILSCAFAWVYQVNCSFDVGNPTEMVRAGETARFALWQSDCLGGAIGHACYDTANVSVEGLPPGTRVGSVEWVHCHETALNILTSTSTPPGIYKLTIKLEDSMAFPEKATLEIFEP